MHTFKLIYTTEKGDSVEFYGRPFRLISFPLGGLSATIQTQQAPYQDGVTLIDTLLESINLPITLRITAKDYQELEWLKRRLTSLINPKVKGTLKYVSDYQIKVIDVVPQSTPFFPDGQGSRSDTFQMAQIELFAPSPYWKSIEIEEEPAFKPLFKFPFTGPFQMGLQQIERKIYNDGDAPTPIVIEFNGPAENPFVRNNTTGEYIKVKQGLLEGETMLIDTTDGNKKVVFIDAEGNERNVFNWIDLGSTFFKLEIGENEITYGADNVVTTNIVDVRYQKYYNAV